MAEDDELIDVTDYIEMEDIPNYNPQYPRRGVTLTPLPGPPAGSNWVAPSSWGVERRPVRPQQPPPAGEPWVAPASWEVVRRPRPPERLPPPPPTPSPPPPSTPPSLPPEPGSLWVAPASWDVIQRPVPPPAPRTPSPVRKGSLTLASAATAAAHRAAAVQVLNRFASNREAAAASDAAASALSAQAVASSSDPVAAEAERSEAKITFHRRLTLAILEGSRLDGADARPVTTQTAVRIAAGEPDRPDQTFGEWSRENRWRVPESWGGGGGDPNFVPLDWDHDDDDYPACFKWECWLCYCGPGCCGGGGRSTRNRRMWSPGNLD